MLLQEFRQPFPVDQVDRLVARSRRLLVGLLGEAETSPTIGRRDTHDLCPLLVHPLVVGPNQAPAAGREPTVECRHTSRTTGSSNPTPA